MMRLRGEVEDTTELGSVRHLGATADAQRTDPEKATGQRDALDWQMPRVIRLNRDGAARQRAARQRWLSREQRFGHLDAERHAARRTADDDDVSTLRVRRHA
jgi:hypothetical protein